MKQSPRSRLCPVCGSAPHPVAYDITVAGRTATHAMFYKFMRHRIRCERDRSFHAVQDVLMNAFTKGTGYLRMYFEDGEMKTEVVDCSWVTRSTGV